MTVTIPSNIELLYPGEAFQHASNGSGEVWEQSTGFSRFLYIVFVGAPTPYGATLLKLGKTGDFFPIILTRTWIRCSGFRGFTLVDNRVLASPPDRIFVYVTPDPLFFMPRF